MGAVDAAYIACAPDTTESADTADAADAMDCTDAAGAVTSWTILASWGSRNRPKNSPLRWGNLVWRGGQGRGVLIVPRVWVGVHVGAGVLMPVEHCFPEALAECAFCREFCG